MPDPLPFDAPHIVAALHALRTHMTWGRRVQATSGVWSLDYTALDLEEPPVVLVTGIACSAVLTVATTEGASGTTDTPDGYVNVVVVRLKD